MLVLLFCYLLNCKDEQSEEALPPSLVVEHRGVTEPPSAFCSFMGDSIGQEDLSSCIAPGKESGSLGKVHSHVELFIAISTFDKPSFLCMSYPQSGGDIVFCPRFIFHLQMDQ